MVPCRKSFLFVCFIFVTCAVLIPAGVPDAFAAPQTGRPDLSIVKTGVTDGQNVTYTITVTNLGNVSAPGPIVVTDLLPTTPVGTSFLSASSGCIGPSSGSANVITCTSPASLAPGAVLTYTIGLSVPAAGAVTNCASVMQTDTAVTPADSNPSNNESCATDAIVRAAPDLSIGKTATVNGQTVTYTITVTNVGTGTATGPIVVTDPLPASASNIQFTSVGSGCSGPAGGPITCIDASNLASGGSLTFSLEVNAPDGGRLYNCAMVTGNLDPRNLQEANHANNQACVTSVVDSPGAPDLAITKVGVVTGNSVSYTLTVTNIGTAPAPGPIVVTDPLPSGPAGVTQSSTNSACIASGGGSIVCTSPGGLAPNATLTFVIVLTVPKGGVVTNCATVRSASDDGPADPNLVDNQSCTTVTVRPDGKPDLEITKTGVVQGQAVNYTFLVNNLGTMNASGPVTVTDHLPLGTMVDSMGEGCSGPDTGPITCVRPGDLEPGGALTFNAVIRKPAGGWMENCATVSQSSNPMTPEINQSNNQSCVRTRVPVPGAPDLKLTKTGTISGNILTFTLLVENIGSAPAPGPIVVRDDFYLYSYRTVHFIAYSSTCTGASTGPIECSDPSSLAAGAALAPITIVMDIGEKNYDLIYGGIFGLPDMNCAHVVVVAGELDSTPHNNFACAPSYALTDLGGATFVSQGRSTTSVDVGYGRLVSGRGTRMGMEIRDKVEESIFDRWGRTVSRISAESGALSNILPPSDELSTPAGLAIFGFRQNGVLVTEASVPASGLIQSGRIYAEVGGPVNTGIAIANPGSQPATVSFFYTDSSGEVGEGSTTIPPYGQIAKFLNQAPFHSPDPIRGTFTFASSVPVSVIALRGFTNERSEFLITTLPVVDLALAATSEAIVFPHFADGGGWTTQIVLINPSDAELTGTVAFQGQDGQASSLVIDGTAGASFAYEIPARSAQRLGTSGAGSDIGQGSVRVIPDPGTRAPSGVGIFSFRDNGVTAAESGVPVIAAGTAFRMFAETSPPSDGFIQTGMAVANNSAVPTVVTVQLYGLDGTSTGMSGTIAVAGNGQAALFLNQVDGFAAMAPSFQGVLRLSSPTSISVIGLRGRYNERGEFLISTTPPVDENGSDGDGDLYFPHIADGAGYSTQFILFSGRAGQVSSGAIGFFSQSGELWNLFEQSDE